MGAFRGVSLSVTPEAVSGILPLATGDWAVPLCLDGEKEAGPQKTSGLGIQPDLPQKERLEQKTLQGWGAR